MRKTTYIYGMMLSILLGLLPFDLPAQPASKSDTITNRILSSQGKAKLDAYYSACMLSATRSDVTNEIRLLRAYEAEAARQKNPEHEMHARTLRLFFFYNNNLPDSLNACIDDDLRFFEQHKQWDYYYSSRSLRVERLRYSKQLQSALREAQAMYEHACRQGTDYGKGVSAYLIAGCYQNMNRNKEAVDFFRQAEAWLVKENNIGQMHNVYAIAWESFAAIGEYDELQKLTGRWETMWKEYCRKNDLQLSSVAPYYIVCLLTKAHVYIDKRDLPSARKELDNAAALAAGLLDIARTLWIKEEARYEEAAGNYEHALDYLNECSRLQTEQDNRMATIETQEMRARLLLKLGKSDEAARIYAELLPRKDSLYRMDTAAQLDDLSSMYKVDMLKMEKEQFRHWTIITTASCGLFFLILVGYVFYNRRIHIKNHAIFLQYQKQKQTEEWIEKMLEHTSRQKTLDKHTQLFLEIRKLVQDPEVLSDPSLDRTFLAKKLNTNHMYIAKAVQAGMGLTVKKYINQNRIDYACELLKLKDRYSISQIQEKCGFQSSSSFNRSFKEHMHMTPSEFQKESCQ